MKRSFCLAVVALAIFGVLASSALAGTVEGTVTPVEWAQEVEVCAIDVQVSEWCAVPGADGSYVYPGVVGKVTFEFIPTYRSNLLPQYFDHAEKLVDAKYKEVGPEVLEGIDADLLEGGSITGVVMAQSGGARLPEVEVCAVPVAPLTSRSCGETNADGEYTLHSLPSGLYNIGFWGQGRSVGYESTYHEEESQVRPVAVTAGRATVGVNVELVEGGRISGRIFAAESGLPQRDIAVCLFSGTEVAPRRCTDSEEGGIYAFQGLPSGSYQVGYSLEAVDTGGGEATAGADGFASQYYEGVAARTQAAAISLLAPETVEGIDAHLVALPAVAPAAAAPIVSSPPSASAAIVRGPELTAARCKQPKHRAVVGGRIRCVKPAKTRKPKKTGKPKKNGRS